MNGGMMAEEVPRERCTLFAFSLPDGRCRAAAILFRAVGCHQGR